MLAKHSGRLTECILVAETEVNSYFQSPIRIYLELLTCSLVSGSLAASAIRYEISCDKFGETYLGPVVRKVDSAIHRIVIFSTVVKLREKL